MKFTTKTQKPQPTVQSETAANWQDCVVEELDEAAGAAVVGGAGKSWKFSSYPRNYDGLAG
jgi:hypothetical protein